MYVLVFDLYTQQHVELTAIDVRLAVSVVPRSRNILLYMPTLVMLDRHHHMTFKYNVSGRHLFIR